MTNTDIGDPLRTDESYRDKQQPEHQEGRSPLELINLHWYIYTFGAAQLPAQLQNSQEDARTAYKIVISSLRY